MKTLREKLGHTDYRPESSYPPDPPKSQKRIRCSRDVFETCRDISESEQEIGIVLLLNSKHQVTRRVVVGVGTLASVDLHPREVFREAVRSTAAAFFLIHNHPSGNPEPSADDIALTARIRECGVLLGIPLLDHVIVVKDGYVSLADRGVV